MKILMIVIAIFIAFCAVDTTRKLRRPPKTNSSVADTVTFLIGLVGWGILSILYGILSLPEGLPVWVAIMNIFLMSMSALIEIGFVYCLVAISFSILDKIFRKLFRRRELPN